MRGLHRPCKGVVAQPGGLFQPCTRPPASGRQQAQRLSRTTQSRASSTHEAVALVAEDQWIQKLLNLLPPDPARENEHQQECIETLRTQRMPTTRNEEYRFTDVSMLLRTDPQIASGQTAEVQWAEHSLQKDDDAIRLVVVDGSLSAEFSSYGGLSKGAYIGNLQQAPQEALNLLGSQARVRGGPFAILNGALSKEILCISLSEATELEKPIHIVYYSTGRTDSQGLSVSNPRLLVHLGRRSGCQIIEEFVSAESSGQSFSNSVTEVFLEAESQLNHKYVELEGSESWHMKASLVSQAEGSKYQLTETQLGGRLTRHDLSIQQTGPDTETTMKAFLLCGPSQLHDLHSKLKLEHPRAQASQLHKCIVSASSGRGVFDGNVKVERYAQQTDAAQLSRNILLSPKATVNVKPNLQIVADDVKCSHGCAVSDLEEEQLFYFRARGIDYATARQVLVYSFGSEVTNDFKFEHLVGRIQNHINATLAKAPLS